MHGFSFKTNLLAAIFSSTAVHASSRSSLVSSLSFVICKAAASEHMKYPARASSIPAIRISSGVEQLTANFAAIFVFSLIVFSSDCAAR